MKTIFVFYYLLGDSGNSKSVDRYLESFESWVFVGYNAWFIKTNKTVSEIRDEMKKHLPENSRVLTLDVTGAPWATFNFDKDVNEWMKTDL